MPELSGAFGAYIVVLSGVLGLVFGSFINCACFRLVRGGTALFGRSECPYCKHTLAPRDLVPLFSFLFLRGRCRYCKHRLPLRYPLSEAVTALLFVLVTLKFGFSLETLEYLVLVCCLLAISLTDIDSGMIYDRFIVIGIVDFALFTFIGNFSAPFKPLMSGLAGGLSVALPLLIVVLVMDKVMKRETMGGGDIKLFFMAGLFLGWKLALLSVLLSCVIGIVFAIIYNKCYNKQGMPENGRGAFPFGPSICMGAFVALIFGQPVIDLYISFF